MKSAALSAEQDFLRITGENLVCYGGDQAWFPFTVGRHGGCGTVAAANITAYLADRHPSLAGLYEGSGFDQASFLRHMEAVYRWVRPWRLPLMGDDPPPWRNFGWTFGVWPIGRLARGTRRFAASRGVVLMDRRIGSRRPLEELLAFIADSLGRDCPVAMLIGRKPAYRWEAVTRPDGSGWLQRHFSLHWVVITKLAEREGRVMVKVSTWGGFTWLDLRLWQEAGGLLPGLVSFAWNGD